MRKVVLVSLDALYDADLAWLGEDSFMGGLLRDSAVSTRVKTIFPALTYPTHVTMVTGENPAAHGIGHNRPYQPGVEPRLCRWYWEAEHIPVPTLFDAVKKTGGESAAIFWPVTGKSGNPVESAGGDCAAGRESGDEDSKLWLRGVDCDGRAEVLHEDEGFP